MRRRDAAKPTEKQNKHICTDDETFLTREKHRENGKKNKKKKWITNEANPRGQRRRQRPRVTRVGFRKTYCKIVKGLFNNR